MRQLALSLVELAQALVNVVAQREAIIRSLEARLTSALEAWDIQNEARRGEAEDAAMWRLEEAKERDRALRMERIARNLGAEADRWVERYLTERTSKHLLETENGILTARVEQLELDNFRQQDEINALRIAIEDYLAATAAISKVA